MTIFPTLCSSKTPPSYSTRSLSSRDREWNRGARSGVRTRSARRPSTPRDDRSARDTGWWRRARTRPGRPGRAYTTLEHPGHPAASRAPCALWLRGARRAGAGCLHLKSAVTRAGSRTLVANPSWVDPALMPGWDVIPVDAREPHAGNVLWLGGDDRGRVVRANECRRGPGDGQSARRCAGE